MNTATYLCIGCPLGCRLEVDEDEEGQIVEIRGFSCKRGKVYAEQEHTAPRRMVTTTVDIKDDTLLRGCRSRPANRCSKAWWSKSVARCAR